MGETGVFDFASGKEALAWFSELILLLFSFNLPYIDLEYVKRLFEKRFLDDPDKENRKNQ
jgi:hypothetical protein